MSENKKTDHTGRFRTRSSRMFLSALVHVPCWKGKRPYIILGSSLPNARTYYVFPIAKMTLPNKNAIQPYKNAKSIRPVY